MRDGTPPNKGKTPPNKGKTPPNKGKTPTNKGKTPTNKKKTPANKEKPFEQGGGRLSNNKKNTFQARGIFHSNVEVYK